MSIKLIAIFISMYIVSYDVCTVQRKSVHYLSFGHMLVTHGISGFPTHPKPRLYTLDHQNDERLKKASAPAVIQTY